VPLTSIYLDHNSTTPLDPRVLEGMTRVWRDCGANPASQHTPGRKARRLLEDAREGILELLGAKTGGMDADQLVFTSGGTEANNLALFGLSAGSKPAPGEPPSAPAITISAIEHPSIKAAAQQLIHRGHHLECLHIHSNFIIDEATKLEALSAEARCVISVMLANNETGITLPVAAIVEWADRLRVELQERFDAYRYVRIHTDAVQAVGKIPVHFRSLGVDAMTVAPHKFHGPIGVGALVLKDGVKLQPQLHGGFQQGGLRPGTENVALAVGFHEALQLATAELSVRAAHMQSLRDELERTLRRELPEMVIIGEQSPRLPNTSCVSFPGVDRQALVMALDLAGVACSTGSACASGSSEPSPTLVAMGLPQAVVQGAIRLSVGAITTAAEIDEASRRILKTVKHLKSAK